MRRVYYNEFDPFAAAWLRNLIAAALLPEGDVDERSIVDVRGSDLAGYGQCHFFAGIGGWAYALALAGWGERPVWTGSCPCQPLSSAGQRKGHADERHLWPAFYRLIAECRPAAVFGEQVASKDGREWLAGVRADLEALGYAIGGADLCAAGVAAPHIRQRLYWLADAQCSERRALDRACGVPGQDGLLQREEGPGRAGIGSQEHDRLADADSTGEDGRPPGGEQSLRDVGPGRSSGLGDGDGDGCKRPEIVCQARIAFPAPWASSQFISCPDGLRRIPVEPEIFPMADGVPARMGTLRGAGNAIVPQVAALFVSACLDVMPAHDQ